MTMMTETNPCVGLLGLLFGHRFEPRYSTSLQPCANIKMEEGLMSAAAFHRIMDSVVVKTVTYKGDMCRRCGAVANRVEEDKR